MITITVLFPAKKREGPGTEIDLNQNKKNPDRATLLATPGSDDVKQTIFKFFLTL